MPLAGFNGSSVVGVQLLVEGDGLPVDATLHFAGLAVADEQQIGAAGQLSCLHRASAIAVFVDQRHPSAGGDVESGLDGAAVAQRDAGAGVGANQALAADADDDLAAAGQGAHDACAAADVGAVPEHDTLGDAALNHVGAERRGIEIDRAIGHHRGAFAEIGAEPDAARIGDAHAAWHDVVGHLGELVHREHFKVMALHPRPHLPGGQLVQRHRPFGGPSHGLQVGEDAVEVERVGQRQPVGEQVQLQKGLGG